jgi:hypothetical protein
MILRCIFSGDQRAERFKAVVLPTSMMRSAFKKIVCGDRTIALKLKVEELSVLGASVHADIGVG